jgi:hypothetical protein
VLNAVGSYSDVAILTDLELFLPLASDLERLLEVPVEYGLKSEPLFHVDLFDTRSRDKAGVYKNVIVVGYLRGKDRASQEIRRRLGGEQMKVLVPNALFLTAREDIYARNQNVLFLAGNDRNQMQSLLRQHAAALRGQIAERNRERVRAFLVQQGRNLAAEQRISQQAGFRLTVPVGFELGKLAESAEGDLGCVEVIATGPTRSVAVFWAQIDPADVDLDDHDALLELRRRWGHFLDETLQDAFGFTWAGEMFRGEQWPMLAGMYETNVGEYGGPFRTVFLVDVPSQRLYGVNWLCFAPNLAKGPLMREVHALAETFVPRP